MPKQFYIIIGKSGSGKGTQAPLLKAYLESTGHQSVKHITTGGAMREFVATHQSLTRDLASNMMEKGELLPPFFAIWNCINILINNLNKSDTIILEGAPRELSEAKILGGIFPFYGYNDVNVIYIDVSDTWAIQRLIDRGRSDDSDRDKVEQKMEWFAKDVLNVIDWYKHINTQVKFLHINGEQSPEQVFADIKKSIKMYA